MNADSLKIAKVFSGGGDVHYVLPHFQREYAWEKENWQTLMDDVVGVYEEYDAGNDPEHFMGALVVVNDGTRNGTVPVFKLVDGQQRLTTISLVLSALDHVVQASLPLLSKRIRKLLLNADEDGDLRFKLLPTTKYGDRLAYKAIVAGDTDVPVVDSKIPQAFAFFQKELRYQVSQGTIDPEKLFIVLTNSLHVVFINLNQNERPFEIFESLNHKGKALSQADLVRNYIAMRLPEGKQEDAFNRYWSEIETVLQEKRDVGRSRIGELTSFIRHYLAFHTGNLCNQRHVYERFRDRMEKQFNAPDAFLGELAELRRFAEYYDCMLRPSHEANADIREAYERLNTLETTTFYPFLLAARDALNAGRMNEADYIAGLNVLENYTVRRFLTGEPNNFLNTMTPALWRNITVERYAESLKQALTARSYPNDAKVSHTVIHEDLFDTSKPTRDKVTLILETINRHLSLGSDGHTVLGSAPTIEHIMPQTLDSLWKHDLGSDWESTYRDLLNTLGNLTLVTQEWNSSLSNSAFSVKRGKLAGHALRLNSSYFDRTPTWDREAIQQRGEFLVRQILEIWPSIGDPPVPTTEVAPTPRALIFNGERFAVSSWRDVTYLTAVGIAQLLGDQFSSFVEKLPNFKLEPFKYASRQLSNSRQLDNGYWVNLNLSVAAARNFCRSMLSSAGIPDDDWQVDFSNSGAAPKISSKTGNTTKPAPANAAKAQSTTTALTAPEPLEDFATAKAPDFQPLEQQFDEAMRTTYEDAVRHGYIPARFLQMLNERGGIGTARYLLAKPDTQQGLFKLWELGQLESSMEALVMQSKYEALFTDEERAEARRRLEELGFFK